MANDIIIEDDVRGAIISILSSKLPEDCRGYLFGSRATGKAKPFSDVDVALDNSGQPVPEAVLSALRSSFEFSSLPYKVDIVDINIISEGFRRAIEPQLVPFFG